MGCMNPLLKLGFEHCGYTVDYLRDIYTAHYDKHFMFKDEAQVLLGLKEIYDSKELIVVFSDFDMDGISAGCILYAGLSLFGFNVKLFTPTVSRGYGMHVEDIDDLHSEFPECKYIITCDVGITSYDAIQYAIDTYQYNVFVTDHHIESSMRVPAKFIIDPSRTDETCDFKGVCGAYVAYHLMTLLAELFNDEQKIGLIKHLVLFASLGSMGDLMPLLYDTRHVVYQGIQEFNKLLDNDIDDYFGCDSTELPDVFVAPFENLQKLHYYLQREGIVQYGEIDEGTYGYTYCPLFNSIKRMNSSMSKLYELLYTRYSYDDDENDKFLDLCDWITELNDQRKILTDSYFNEIMADEAAGNQKYSPFIFVTNAPSGLLGLLSMRIMSITGRPCMVVNMLREDTRLVLAGSGRLPSWFDPSKIMYDGIVVAGHAQAFGISIDLSMVDIKAYVKHLKEAYDSELIRVDDEIKQMQADGTYVDPRVYISVDKCVDSDFDVSTVDDFDICFDYSYAIREYMPFGSGFNEPEFVLSFKKSDIKSSTIMKEKHTKYVIPHNITLIYFNQGIVFQKEYLDTLDDSDIVSVIGKFSINTFRGYTNLQFMISDYIC